MIIDSKITIYFNMNIKTKQEIVRRFGVFNKKR